MDVLKNMGKEYVAFIASDQIVCFPKLVKQELRSFLDVACAQDDDMIFFDSPPALSLVQLRYFFDSTRSPRKDSLIALARERTLLKHFGGAHIFQCVLLKKYLMVPLSKALNQTYHNFKQDSRYYFSFSADRADEVVERFILLADTSGSEPTCDGFSGFGKDNSSEDCSQSPCRALMQDAAKSDYPDLPAVRENPFVSSATGKHRLSFANVCFVSTKHIGKDEPFL